MSTLIDTIAIKGPHGLQENISKVFNKSKFVLTSTSSSLTIIAF